MCGKDVVYKIMAQGKATPKLHIRQKYAAVVNVETYKSKNKKVSNEGSNEELNKKKVSNEDSNKEEVDHNKMTALMYTSIDSDSDNDSGSDC